MNKYAVIWSDAAAHDLESIIGYIAKDSIDTALRILKQLQDKASTLLTLPQRGRIVPELKQHGILQYRELVVSPWRIIYRRADRVVYILAVIDSRRNVEDVLLDRLTRQIQ